MSSRRFGYVKVNIHRIIQRGAAAHPQKTAVVFPDERATYAELETAAANFSRTLKRLGVRPGDVVATFMPNCVDLIAYSLAVWRLGATVLSINTRHRSQELRHILDDSGAVLLLVGNRGASQIDLVSRVRETLGEVSNELDQNTTPCQGLVIESGGRAVPIGPASAQMAELSRIPAESRTSEVDTPAILLYTSGTTAAAKGCFLSHRQIFRVTRQVGERAGFGPTDVVWNALPLCHTGGILPMIATWLYEGTFVSQITPEPALSLEMIVRERATFVWPGFGQIWQAITALPDFRADDLSNVRAGVCVGPPGTISSLQALMPDAPLLSIYGMTECTGIATMTRFDESSARRGTSSGAPLEGIEIKAVDPESRKPVPVGIRGELLLKGINVIDGYLNDAGAAAFDSDGWLSTGDIGSIDANGYVTYEGRIKDMLRVGGENVSALEVESVLSAHPDVLVSAVVGVPDEWLGEVPLAFVETKSPGGLEPQELIDFCARKISSFKVPRHVVFVDEWPMSATKIRKAELRDRAIAFLANQA